MIAAAASRTLVDRREGTIWAMAFLAATAAGGAFIAAAPLAAYVWLIALFGVPHVVSELRYCDERFSGRSSRTALAIVGALLFALCATRVAHTYGAIPGAIGGKAELIFGAALALAAAAFMRRYRLAGLAVAAAVTFGALYYPYATFLVWAWLHNLTPLAFIAEATKGRERAWTLGLLTIPFFVLPGLVALGGLEWLTESLFGHRALSGGSAFGAGLQPLSAFIPVGTRPDAAMPFFQAAVLSQVMHYLCVIVLMPRLLGRGAGEAGRLAPWPSWPVFYGLLAAAGAVSVSFYAIDFGEARSAYALAATLHSWIELPIFLIALGQGFRLPAFPRATEPAGRPALTTR
ncbi:MAG: hypothetical protein QM698_11840 [Micropepsaceae bacterium]